MGSIRWVQSDLAAPGACSGGNAGEAMPGSAQPGCDAGQPACRLTLGVRWRPTPVSPNTGKPVVMATFESPEWLGDTTIWITGKAELDASGTDNHLMISKPYDFANHKDLSDAFD